MLKKILIFLFILHLGWRVGGYRQSYLQPFDPDYWQERYWQSQWVMSDPEEPIGDDGLFTYVGWELVHGADPSLVNAETPPLGKYLLGLTTLIFNNQNLFALLSGLLALFAFYLLNRLVFKNPCLALLPVVLFSFEPLFWQQLRAPYLDNLYLSFLLFVFYFFLGQQFWLAAIFLGLMIATKASLASFLLVGLTTSVYLFLKKERSILKKWWFFLPFSWLIFAATYARFFWLGHSPREFLGVQKWVWHFYQTGAKGSFLALFKMIFTGQWWRWWAEATRVTEWQITWPILVLGLGFYGWYCYRRRQLEVMSLFAIWSAIYLFFLGFVPLWPRYLLIFLPFGYNLCVWLGRSLIAKTP